MPQRKKTSFARTWGWMIAALALGMMLRWMWIFPAHPWTTPKDFQDRYIQSDMYEYWSAAAKAGEKAPQWSHYDLFHPPLTSEFFSFALGSSMDHILRMLTLEWAISVIILVEVALMAWLAFGRKVAFTALALASVCFPLFYYAPYVLSEHPFTLLITTGTLLLVAAHRCKDFRILLLTLAGACFALSAGFKSVGFIAGVFLLAVFFSREWSRSKMKRWLCAFCFAFGLFGMTMVPLAMAIERNGGHFIFLSNDVMRIAMANHGDVLGTHTKYPDGGEYTIVSPLMNQRGYHTIREVPDDMGVVLRENLGWLATHPLQGLIDAGARIADLFAGVVPFPTTNIAMEHAGTVLLLQFLTYAFVYVPAAFLLLRKRSGLSTLYRMIFTLPVLALVAVTLIAASEPRYLYPFAGSLIVLAAAQYAGVSSRRHD